MSEVPRCLFELKDQFWSPAAPQLSPAPKAMFADREFSETAMRHFRHAALEGRARALEQMDRKTSQAEAPPLGASHQTESGRHAPALPTESRLDPDIASILQRHSEKRRKDLAKAGELDEKRFEKDHRQRERVISHFVEATGKTKVTELRQEDIAHHVACLARLPSSYNNGKADRHLSLAQILQRGDELPEDEVGLSGPTVNRNLTFAGATLTRAKSDGLRPPEELDLTGFRTKDRKLKRSQRPAFTLSDIAAIFAHPTWHGRQSAARPHSPGEELVRDGPYWAPLIAVYTGARREGHGTGRSRLRRRDPPLEHPSEQ